MLGLFGLDAWAAPTDEMVVTTRQRSENLQDVPIAINAIGATEISRQGIFSLNDVVQLEPSLQYQTGFSPQDTQITIRGLSPERGRVNTAVLLDGVDVTSEAIETIGGSLLIDPALFEMERIEVVKGPQNALFGRSAFAGAISYITKKPTEDFEASINLDAGSASGGAGRGKLNARVAGSLWDNFLLGGLSAMVYDAEGFYDNQVTGKTAGDRDGYALAGTLVYKPVDNISFMGRVNYSDDTFGVQPWSYMDPNLQYPIPQEAIDSGVVPSAPPGFPAPTDVAGLQNLPNKLPLVPGFVPGPTGTFPSAASAGTMSEDPRTCTTQPDIPANQSTCSDFPDGSREVTRGQLNIDWDIGAVALTSITHYADADVEQFHDANTQGSASTLAFLGEVRFATNTELFSQELRLQSTGDRRVGWTVGGLYWDEKIEQASTGYNGINVIAPFAPSLTGTPFTPPIPLTPAGPFMSDVGPQGTYPAFPKNWSRDTTHWSLYGLIDWNIGGNWNLILEGRYVDEDLTVGGPDGDTVIDPLGLGFNQDLTGCVEFELFPGFFVPGSCINPRQTGMNFGTVTDSYFLPKGTLQWAATDSQMYYITIAQAAKPAGISALNGGIGAFDPIGNEFEREEMISYELGGKTAWIDSSLFFNFAAFYYDYSDKQVGTQVIDPTTGLLTTRTVNAAKATVYGIELSANWQVTDHLNMGAGYTFLKSEYDDYVQRTSSASQIAYGGNCTPLTTSPPPPATPQTTCQVNYSGNNLENAPENAFVANAGYRRPMTESLDWLVEGNMMWQDFRYVNAGNTLKLDDYSIWNFRLGVASDRWDAVAFIDNAFDDDTVKNGFDSIDSTYLAADFSQGFTLLVPSGARYMLPDPRTYGVRVSYRFGK